jgi:hypothetical protein
MRSAPCLVTRHSSLTTAVSPTLKVSNHWEPNDRYHRKIKNRPVCPTIFLMETASIFGNLATLALLSIQP